MRHEEPSALDLTPPPSTFVAKGRFGRYTLLWRLGESRLGEVFVARLATIAGFEKQLVLKILHPALVEDARMTRLFLAEAHAAGKVQHANVCEVRDVGQAEGTYFIVYEHLVGVPLSSVMRRIRRTRDGRDLRLVTALAVQACEGLHAAHDQGVIHKDLNPERLFVTAEGVVKILGLGVPARDEMIRRTGPGTVRFGYSSPEEVRGEPISRRSNVFSLGTILFELITGRRLFARDSEYLLCRAITEDPIPEAAKARSGLPEGMNAALREALARDGEERLPSARALGEALGEAVRPLGGPLHGAAVAEDVDRLCGDEIFSRVAPLRRLAEAERREDERRTERITDEEPIVTWRRDDLLRRATTPILIFLATFGGVLLTWLALR